MPKSNKPASKVVTKTKTKSKTVRKALDAAPSVASQEAATSGTVSVETPPARRETALSRARAVAATATKGAMATQAPLVAPTTVTRVLPAHVTTAENTRLLTLADIEACDPCGAHGREALNRFMLGTGRTGFVQIDEVNFVNTQTRRVPRLWGRRQMRYFETVTHKDIAWAAKRLLPEGWYTIYREAVDSAIKEASLRGGRGRTGMYKTRMRVRFATFAALYLEAGRPDAA